MIEKTYKQNGKSYKWVETESNSCKGCVFECRDNFCPINPECQLYVKKGEDKETPIGKLPLGWLEKYDYHKGIFILITD